MKGIAIILLFLLLGNGVSLLIGGLIPGSVCGMLLLFGALLLGWVKPSDVRGIATALTQNMTLFFIPAAVSIMAAYGLIADNWAALIVVPLATTILIVITVGHLQQFLEKRIKK